MGFFGNLFKSKEERELEEIFGKIRRLLNDDEMQMGSVPPMFLDMYDNRQIDMLPNGRGEFGKTPKNPIPVNGPLGEVTYLSKLLLAGSKEKIFFHRLGSCEGHIDIFQVISLSGNFTDTLYLDMYHTKKSRYCPQGYVFQDMVYNIRGINGVCSNFPMGFYDVLRESTQRMIGFPAFDTDAKNINIQNAIRTMNR